MPRDNFNEDPADLQRRVDEGDPTAKHMRQQAKAINFAVVYGAGPAKVASMAGVSESRAREILDKHYGEPARVEITVYQMDES